MTPKSQAAAELAAAVRDFRHNIEHGHINNGAMVSGDQSYKEVIKAHERYEQAPADAPAASAELSYNLAALIRQICAHPNSKDAKARAMDFLARHNLQGSILREEQARQAAPEKEISAAELIAWLKHSNSSYILDRAEQIEEWVDAIKAERRKAEGGAS